MNSSHIIIGGTGRAGTTLLMQIFTLLDLDTGFSKEHALNKIDKDSRGGLERSLFDKNLPTFIKSPNFCHEIKEAIASGIEVKTAIIPVRSLEDAAESRIAISKVAAAKGKNPLRVAGGLWDCKSSDEQESVLAINFYEFIESLIKSNIEIIFLDFPRFVLNPEYLYGKLKKLLDEYQITYVKFREIFELVVDPKMIGQSVRNSDSKPSAVKIDMNNVLKKDRTSLDLGCGKNPKNPFNAVKVCGVDIRATDNDNIRVADLAVMPIPFQDNSFDYVTAFDFIEHIPRVSYLPQLRFCFVELMNEIYRVLKPGGIFLSYTPAYPAAEAFQDPTHVNIITEKTFPIYFCMQSRSASIYGFNGYFKLEKNEWNKQRTHLISMLRKLAVA